MSVVIFFALLYAGFTASSPVQDDLGPEWNDWQIGPLGALPPTPEMIAEVGYKDVVYDENEEIPKEFDARVKWPHCISLKTIWNQGCGSCWAVSSVSVMGDRYCIRNQGNVILSAYNLMSCCKGCAGNPCNGGYSHKAFQHWNTTGLVTGGPTPCSGCTCYRYKGPNLFQCDHQCRKGYEKPYKEDLTYGRKVKFLKRNAEVIQREIMTNGPVVSTFKVYSDFARTRNNVYIRQSEKVIGYHSVRVIGWGVQNVTGKSVPYWLAVNSWGPRWGDKGLFRILRGSNHCQFETNVVAD